MNQKIIENTVLNHLKRVMERDDITLEIDLLGEDGISSIEAMDLLSGLESEFHIRISPRNLRRVSTAMDLVELITEMVE